MTKAFEKKKRQWAIAEDGMSVWDYVLFFILAVACFLCFVQPGIEKTAASANALLNGHILDFYEYNAAVSGGSVHLPSTYIVFALWNVPLKLFGMAYETADVSVGIVFWYKILPCIAYLLSGYVLYKTAREMGMGSGKSKMIAYGFLTAPIAFFSQFMLGQYGVFAVLFMLLGLLYYVKKDVKRFILFFGIAVTFNYAAALFFVPLLLLREKKFLKLLLYLPCLLIPAALEAVFYIGSSAFRSGVLDASVVEHITATGFTIFNHVQLSMTVLLYLMVCAWAYFTVPADRTEESRFAMFFLNGVIFISFGLSMWRPEWLLMAMPFFVLSTFAHKRPDAFLLLDLVMMLMYIMICVNVWPNVVDQNLMCHGILAPLCAEQIQYALPMRRIFIFTDIRLLYTVMSALLFVNATFKHPKLMQTDFSESVRKYWNLVRARFILGLALFLIPACLSFVATQVSDVTFLVVPHEEAYEVNAGAMVEGYQVSQDFIAEKDNIARIEVYMKTFDNNIDTTMDVFLTDVETGEVIMKHKILCSMAFDNSYVFFKKLPHATLVVGKQYRITFESLDAKPHNCISLFGNTQSAATPTQYASINGEPQAYNLCVNLYGK